MLNTAPPSPARQIALDFRRLGKRKRIINIDTEVSNGVFDLGVSKQNLNSSKIAGSLVDQGSLGAAERMCSLFLGTQANRRNPFIDQSRVLSGTKVPSTVNSARERVVVDTATMAFEPREQTCPCVCGDLELDGPGRSSAGSPLIGPVFIYQPRRLAAT